MSKFVKFIDMIAGHVTPAGREARKIRKEIAGLNKEIDELHYAALRAAALDNTAAALVNGLEAAALTEARGKLAQKMFPLLPRARRQLAVGAGALGGAGYGATRLAKRARALKRAAAKRALIRRLLAGAGASGLIGLGIGYGARRYRRKRRF